MSAEVKWENDNKQVIVFKFKGYWTLDEYYGVFNQSNTMLDTITHKANMIIDVTESRSIPSGFMSALRTVSKRPHPNSGKVAMMGISPFVRAFIQVVRQVLRKRPEDQWMQIVDTYDEAHTLFASIKEDKPAATVLESNVN